MDKLVHAVFFRKTENLTQLAKRVYRYLRKKKENAHYSWEAGSLLRFRWIPDIELDFGANYAGQIWHWRIVLCP